MQSWRRSEQGAAEQVAKTYPLAERAETAAHRLGGRRRARLRPQVSSALTRFFTHCATVGENVPEIVALAEATSTWHEEIANAILRGLPDATTEGVDWLIRLVYRSAFGLTNVTNQQRRAAKSPLGAVARSGCTPLQPSDTSSDHLTAASTEPRRARNAGLRIADGGRESQVLGGSVCVVGAGWAWHPASAGAGRR
ncbi:transposase [Pseudofrankia sp. DC12]|uniref:transposase n=1 Tax=Pseudofrankia sp. DC12 TaxID=683315 RepID=UPI001E5D02AF|nr:transposase [Pseudofrankia sp. DC12]